MRRSRERRHSGHASVGSGCSCLGRCDTIARTCLLTASVRGGDPWPFTPRGLSNCNFDRMLRMLTLNVKSSCLRIIATGLTEVATKRNGFVAGGLLGTPTHFSPKPTEHEATLPARNGKGHTDFDLKGIVSRKTSRSRYDRPRKT